MSLKVGDKVKIVGTIKRMESDELVWVATDNVGLWAVTENDLEPVEEEIKYKLQVMQSTYPVGKWFKSWVRIEEGVIHLDEDPLGETVEEEKKCKEPGHARHFKPCADKPRLPEKLGFASFPFIVEEKINEVIDYLSYLEKDKE